MIQRTNDNHNNKILI